MNKSGGRAQMALKINYNTNIISNLDSHAVAKAISNLKRDIKKVCLPTDEIGNYIVLVQEDLEEEQFKLTINEKSLEIHANDDLGFIYGIYEVSKQILGILPFWFWNDQKIVKKQAYEVEEKFEYQSEKAVVRYRGWFVNDEVLIHKWSVDRKKERPWEMVFEALLRCRGNLIVPGTDKNAHIYRHMASEMGLYITHHHAEPLGAPMFAREYPDLNPSYAEHPEKFHQLWQAGIDAQKDMNVIWNLGFRGQGDCPFWDNDPQYQTSESRGELMSKLIMMQYELVKKACPNARCCTNLYGETMELYQDGYLNLPDNIIKIWADNGYGKMVTRRQGNHNPRIYALPKEGGHGSHGIYYHASFYDLQAANHITMSTNTADFLAGELKNVIDHNVKDYWIINCSNVKPHVYTLDLIAALWNQKDVNVKEHRKQYIANYYGIDHVDLIAECFEKYAKASVQYGEHEDEHAGEQFCNHISRILVHQYLKDKTQRSEELLWATDADTLEGQISWYKSLCEKGIANYKQLVHEYEEARLSLDGHEKTLFDDSLYLQAKIYDNCYQGAVDVCDSLLNALDEQYQKAFYMAGCARKKYLKGNQEMRDREHGKWHNFYQNECLTDVKQTAWVLETLMSYVRNLGDGPHFYEWQREYLYNEEDRRVLLIYNMDNHLKDQELFELMQEKLDN